MRYSVDCLYFVHFMGSGGRLAVLNLTTNKNPWAIRINMMTQEGHIFTKCTSASGLTWLNLNRFTNRTALGHNLMNISNHPEKVQNKMDGSFIQIHSRGKQETSNRYISYWLERRYAHDVHLRIELWSAACHKPCAYSRNESLHVYLFRKTLSQIRCSFRKSADWSSSEITGIPYAHLQMVIPEVCWLEFQRDHRKPICTLTNGHSGSLLTGTPARSQEAQHEQLTTYKITLQTHELPVNCWLFC